jgi:hypothetical protein
LLAAGVRPVPVLHYHHQYSGCRACRHFGFCSCRSHPPPTWRLHIANEAGQPCMALGRRGWATPQYPHCMTGRTPAVSCSMHKLK